MEQAERAGVIQCLKELANDLASPPSSAEISKTFGEVAFVFGGTSKRESTLLFHAVASGAMLVGITARLHLLSIEESYEKAEMRKCRDRLQKDLNIKGDIPDALAATWYVLDRLSPGGEPMWRILDDTKKIRAKFHAANPETFAMVSALVICAGLMEDISRKPDHRDNGELKPLLRHNECRSAATIILKEALKNVLPIDQSSK